MKYCYLNGKIVPLNKAGIHPTDLGFLRAYGVFDFMITYNGKPFLFKEHFQRLKSSAKLLNLKLLTERSLYRTIKILLAKNKFKEASIRIVLTGGRSRDGMHFHSSSPTLFILTDELKKISPRIYKKGVKLITLNYQREIPEAKTLNYIPAVRLFNGQIKKKRAFEILYVYNNHILECSTSNFFIFRNDTLITPQKDILKGITRHLVLKLAKKRFKIQKRMLMFNELKLATEAFLTASNKEIVPVIKIDNFKIGNGKVGKNTKELMKIFHEFTKRY
jgi:branched-subunit amino acid aminotransferase/4-amino-4-deoxychorismate lyase